MAAVFECQAKAWQCGGIQTESLMIGIRSLLTREIGCTQLRKLCSRECWNRIQIIVHFTSRRSTTWWSHQKVVRLREVGIDLGVDLFILVAAVCMQANKTLLVPTPRLRTGLFNKIMPPEDANKEILRKCSTALVGPHPAARVHGTVQGVDWHARVHGTVQGVV